ncbi:MAG: cytochrome c maturation protein CcmE [Actinomycetota bacterium]|nr:cytochrome c maturation protein CcmE [Actinomycetota bacterium]
MRQRLFLVPGIGLVLVMLGVLLYGNLNRNLVYYLTPTEAVQQQGAFPEGRRFRLGGQVLPGSVSSTSDGLRFELGDGLTTVAVVHQGAVGQLFEEGIGVVVEGSWEGARFASNTMLVRHDEEYRAPNGEGAYRPPGEAAP